MRMGHDAPRAMARARRSRLVIVLACALGAFVAAEDALADAGTLGFSDAVVMATRHTPATKVAALKTREAEARAAQARGLLLPALTGTASQFSRTANLQATGLRLPRGPGFSIPDLIGPYDVMDARLTARQPLFDAASWYRLRAARAAIAGASADGDAVAEQAAQGAALAYLRAARAQAIVAARESDVRLARELLSLAELQQRAGTAPAIDSTRALTQVIVAQGALDLARNAAARARIDLARALGLEIAALPALSDTLSESLGASDAPADTAAVASYARAHRPELAAEGAKLRRARIERTAIGAERLPRLDVTADWGVSGTRWSEAFPTRQYGAAVTVPIVDGLRREARIGEQRSIERESELRLGDLNDQVAAEVGAAELDLASGAQQMTVATEQMALAEAELAQARERLTSGVSGNFEVIEAQRSIVHARDAVIEARYAIASGRVAVARAAGVARTLH